MNLHLKIQTGTHVHDNNNEIITKPSIGQCIEYLGANDWWYVYDEINVIKISVVTPITSEDIKCLCKLREKECTLEEAEKKCLGIKKV